MKALATILVLAPVLACAAGCTNTAAPPGETESNEAAYTELAATCDDPSSPDLGAKQKWHHTVESWAITHAGSPNHRGRDQIYVGGKQWVIGKFAYGLNDKDLKDEDVDVYLERGCRGSWEKLGTARTTEENQHATVEGVEDSGGRVYFEIPAEKRLAFGRHRVRLVVAGDHSSTDLILEVLPPFGLGNLVVTDVDGTLTSSESAEWPALLNGTIPEAHPDAAKVITALTRSPMTRPVYLTARPEWLTGRTREFLKQHGFPPGIVHTTTGLTGANGKEAAKFKADELQYLRLKSLSVSWAFGNKESDAIAYATAGVKPLDHRVFFKYDDPQGGRRIESYSELLPELEAAP